MLPNSFSFSVSEVKTWKVVASQCEDNGFSARDEKDKDKENVGYAKGNNIVRSSYIDDLVSVS